MIQQICLLSIATSPVASTAGNQWLLFLMGRTLIAVMKHAKKIFLLNYSKGYVFASPTDCGETEVFGFRAQKTWRHVVCYSVLGQMILVLLIPLT